MDSEMEFEFQSSSLPQSSFMFFHFMRERNEYCDVILRAGNISVPAHSIVIAAAIPYLRNTLSNKGSEKEVDIPKVDDLKPSAIQSMIEYAYHGKIQCCAANVLDLLFAACRFQMDEVRNSCCNFLAENLCPSNAIRVRDLACQMSCEDLVQAADRYIAEHFDDMSKTDDFLNCSFEVLKKLTERDDLVVKNEETMYETVMRWIAHSEERKSHLERLISNVRLSLLDPFYLRLKVSSNELISKSGLCSFWVNEVTNHFMFPDKVVLGSEYNTEPRRYMNTGFEEERYEPGQSPPHLCDDARRRSVSETSIDCIIQRSPNGETGEQDGHRTGQLRRQLQSAASDSQFRDVLDGASAEDDDPGGIYAIHAKMVFVIQHFNDKKKRWIEKKENFFTINTASVTGLDDKICFLDSENMCYYNPSDKTLSFTENYVQGRAVTAVGGVLYVFGGSDGQTVFNTAEYFDPRSEEWLDLNTMGKCREYACCVALGEYLYIIGGNDLEVVHSSVERYHIQNSEWSGGVEPTQTGRSKLGAASLNGKIYICGGIISVVEQECTRTAEVYDPNTNQWIPISRLNTARVNFTLLPYSGKLYAVGGHDEEEYYVNSTDIYDPRNGKWQLGYPLVPELQITGATVM